MQWLNWKEAGIRGSEFIFRGLRGSGNGVTAQRKNQKKILSLWNLQDSRLPCFSLLIEFNIMFDLVFVCCVADRSPDLANTEKWEVEWRK